MSDSYDKSDFRDTRDLFQFKHISNQQLKLIFCNNMYNILFQEKNALFKTTLA